MWELHDIERLLERSGVYMTDVALRRQRLEHVIYQAADKRSSIFRRSMIFEDMLFCLWAFCLPLVPQRRNYSEFMSNVREELFSEAPLAVVADRARHFFTENFMALDLYQIVEVTNREGSMEKDLEIGLPVREIQMFNIEHLKRTPIPALGGKVHVVTSDVVVAAGKIEGMRVYNMAGEKVGAIRNVVIDKLSGKVVFATMAAGGVLGIGAKYSAIPWNVLTYNTDRGGYQLDVDREKLEAGPAATEEELRQDKDWGRKVYEYYGSSAFN